MNSILLRHMMGATNLFAGRRWYYEFRELKSAFREEACKKTANRLLERYSSTTKAWTEEKNSEWTCRLYMAAKLVMSATLHINAADYAQNKNLRMVTPYLRYYSTLSLLRAICYTLPEHEWEDGALIRISHERAINGTIQCLRSFDTASAIIKEKIIRKLKAERELISYRAPSNGDDQISEQNQFLSLSTLLAEIAQFNSELFEISLGNCADPSAFVLLVEYLSKIATIEIDGHYFNDREDAYRLDYLKRKHPYPANLQHLMTDGHVDDFFGAWHAEKLQDSSFDPDRMQGIIFDIP